ncbi:MMPL family transporter [Porticoccaceae bacterium LTM1]|nr:MMPL family transporter [Porticoccaceae bacterium LTM1]
MGKRFLSLYEAAILRHPIIALVLVMLVAVGMAFGMPNFKLDASAESLTLEHDTDLDYFREINKRYGSGDFLLVTYTPREGDLFSDEHLNTLDKLRDDLATLDGVDNVISILDVPLLFSPKVTLSGLGQEPRTLLTEGVDREAAKQEFLTSPVYRDLVLSPDGQTTGVMAILGTDDKYIELVRARDALRLKRDTIGLIPAEAEELEKVSAEFREYHTLRTHKDALRVAKARKLMDPYREYAEVFLGGPSMITADMIDFIRSDLKVFGISIVLFIILTLAIIFRQLRWVVLPLVTCILSVVIMLGYLSWVDWRLTVISSNFVSLLLIITLALTIHLIVRYRELQAEDPDADQFELVRQTVRYMARPCLYTVLTTVVAFASLVVSDIRPVIDFGWMMTIGITVALALAFIVIPAGMILWGRGVNNQREDRSGAFTLYFSRFAERCPAVVWSLSLVMAGLSLWGVTKLQVDNRFIDYFRDSTEIYQGLSVIDAKLGGTTPLDIILEMPEDAKVDLDFGSNEDDPFASEGDDPFAQKSESEDPFAEEDPFGEEGESETQNSYWFTRAGLNTLEKLHYRLESMPEIGKVSSLVNAFETANELMDHRLDDLELAFMRKQLSPEINNIMIEPYLDDELNEARITLRTKETEGDLRRSELLAHIQEIAEEEVGIKSEDFRMSGLLVLYNNMLQSLYTSQIVTLGAVFLGIMAMFLVLFRSVRFSIIAILPNLLAASVVLGGMGLAGVPLDMMNITIAAITVGIGVDHAIHYITRFKVEFAHDHDYIAAMHRSHGSIGRALYYTAITIIAGFSILALSNFIPSVYFGVLTAFAMLAALLGSLTLLPRLIILIKPLGPNKPAEQ